jgi:hypothetical protein
MKPIYIHSGMVGAPQYANANGNINGILEACLKDGFNSRTATSASASGGVLTLNFASDPRFEPLQTVEVSASSVGAVNGVHRVIANSNNQVTIAIAGLADGTVASSGAGITIKQAGAGWSKPFSNSTVSVFRPPAGNRFFLRCEHLQAVDFSARGYEDMSSIDVGDNPFPSMGQSASATALWNNSYGAPTNATWYLIATDKALVFSMGNANYSVGALVFSDLSDVTKPYDSFSTHISGVFGMYLTRSHTAAVGSVSVTRDGQLPPGNWPSPISEGLRFVPYIGVYEAGALRGFLPNFYHMTPHAPSTMYSETLNNVAGVTGRMKLISLSVANSVVAGVSVDEDAW